ncbi:MAG: Gfo/Idh/MocA family oxidoreductase [Pseudolysinimonas sp.]
MPYGVGIIGAGPGVSALHLPTLARFDAFQVVHIADGGSGRAATWAARVGARSSSGTADLLADPAVDVVVVASPPDRHAGDVLAAVAAGKRAVLCEKPIALTVADAEQVIDACRAAGTALVIGTNHLFDPAWTRAKHHLIAGGGSIQSISVTAALAPNGRYHEAVTEYEPAGAPMGRPAPDWSDAGVASAVVRQLVMGLLVHDLPIVRDLAPRLERVVFARPVPPIGCTVGFIASGVLVQLTAVMLPAGADSLWRMTIGTSVDRVEVDFPPPFVHAGSATVRVRGADGRETRYARSPIDGYLAEWQGLLALLDGSEVAEYDELLGDALFAIGLADAAGAAVIEAM